MLVYKLDAKKRLNNSIQWYRMQWWLTQPVFSLLLHSSHWCCSLTDFKRLNISNHRSAFRQTKILKDCTTVRFPDHSAMSWQCHIPIAVPHFRKSRKFSGLIGMDVHTYGGCEQPDPFAHYAYTQISSCKAALMHPIYFWIHLWPCIR